MPRGPLPALHQGDRLRRIVRPADHGPQLHRQPPDRRARVPARTHGGPRSRHAVWPASVRGRQARREPLRQSERERMNVVDEIDAAPATPDIAAIVREANIESVLEELDHDLVALLPVKTRIREISALLVIDQLRRHAGLAAARPTLHMCFTGNPGTGKTTVAMRMADILHRLGYIERN